MQNDKKALVTIVKQAIKFLFALFIGSLIWIPIFSRQVKRACILVHKKTVLATSYSKDCFHYILGSQFIAQYHL